MFGLFKKKQAQPDIQFAAKGYMQVAVTRRLRPEIDLHTIEHGYAQQLLDGGCAVEQALSARWGGVCAINDDLSNFDDAVAAMREAREESGMSDKMGSKEEAEAMYLASATAVITLTNTLDPGGYQNFLNYIGAR